MKTVIDFVGSVTLDKLDTTTDISFYESRFIRYMKITKRNKLTCELFYRENGTLDKKIYSNDDDNNRVYEYYDNGQVKRKYVKKCGLVQDEVIVYHPNGVIAQTHYEIDGVIIGTIRSFYETGELWQTCEILNGDNRKITQFYKSGVVEHEFSTIGSSREGEAVAYHENGKVAKKCFYKNDKESSLVEFCDNEFIGMGYGDEIMNLLKR